MRIRTSEKSPAGASRRKLSLSSRWLLFLGGLALLLLYSGFLLVMGMSLFRAVQPRGSEMAARAAVREIPERLMESAGRYFEASQMQVPMDRLHLDIAFKDLEKLRAKRLEAIRLGSLIASDDDFVRATIRHDGRSIRTNIRLKGDLLDHLYGDKWSFRVHVRKNDHILGMRRFSLQSPSVRDHQGEAIFLAHLRREGVLAPRYFFVEVVVNGKNIGVMAIEEHFSKELLESQQRREGVILRFDENPFWQNRALNGTFGPYSNPLVAMLRPFRSSKIAKSPKLSGDLTTAIGLMRGFLEEDLKAGDVFDVVLMARFMAVVEVWNAHHALGWHNLRFYFNPLTARLEPIGFDGHLKARPLGPGLLAHSGYFMPFLIEDDDFREVYVRELARIAGEMADGSLARWAHEREDELMPELQEGLEYIDALPIDFLMKRAEKLSHISAENFQHYMPPLGNPDMQYPEPVKVYLCNDCSPARIELVNVLPVPVTVLSIDVTQTSKKAMNEAVSVAGVEFPLELPMTEFMGVPTPVHIAFDRPIDPRKTEVKVVLRVSGQEQRHTVRAEVYPRARTASPVPTVSLDEALAQHSFLNWQEDSQTLRVDAGVWDVQGSLIIPEDIGIVLRAGAELRFREGAFLASSGPLLFQGSSEQPVILRPQAGHESWGGIAGIRTSAPHVWTHVVIEATSGIEVPGWRLTGGVTLRRAQVQISDAVFRGNRAEDALNLVRSVFELENVEFKDTSSDALDADFSNGVVRGGRYSEIGGDGVDVSGAKIELFGVEFSDIADKAISVGEASQLVARDVRIERVGTGAASKDQSELVLEDSFISDALTAGVTVYTKKPEYGPASAVVNRVEMRNVESRVLVQVGSRATIDGEVVAEVPLDTATLY